MADIVDRQTRSRMMAGIKAKDTKPELALRRALHARGFRYRVHARHVPGRPDLLLPKHQAAVFVHGCFWHRHQGCRYTTNPGTRPKFWQNKFAGNILRDAAVRTSLAEEGWRVATIWECALRKPGRVLAAADLLAMWLCSGAAQIDIGELDLSR
jgi:DNA mismatch endonuclease (patch repair protein)